MTGINENGLEAAARAFVFPPTTGFGDEDQRNGAKMWLEDQENKDRLTWAITAYIEATKGEATPTPADDLVAEARELADSARQPHCESPTIAAFADKVADRITALEAIGKDKTEQFVRASRMYSEAEALAARRGEALKFYAEEISWMVTQEKPPYNAIDGDGGTRARSALLPPVPERN